jgi:hypothetical protein
MQRFVRLESLKCSPQAVRMPIAHMSDVRCQFEIPVVNQSFASLLHSQSSRYNRQSAIARCIPNCYCAEHIILPDLDHHHLHQHIIWTGLQNYLGSSQSLRPLQHVSSNFGGGGKIQICLLGTSHVVSIQNKVLPPPVELRCLPEPDRFDRRRVMALAAGLLKP